MSGFRLSARGLAPLVALSLLVLSSAAASAQSRPDWHYSERWTLWAVPTAQAGGAENWGTIAVACGADGKPVIAERVAGASWPPGLYPSFVWVDGAQFSLLWQGWNGIRIANIGPALLNAMRSGRTILLQSRSGGQNDYSLLGAGPVLDRALVGCRSAAAAPHGSEPMLAALKAAIRARAEADCRRDGMIARISEDAFQPVPRMNTPYPDIIVDHLHIVCVGNDRSMLFNCGASKCLHQRYVAGAGVYTLTHEHYE